MSNGSLIRCIRSGGCRLLLCVWHWYSLVSSSCGCTGSFLFMGYSI
jgi:hypothetical protein